MLVVASLGHFSAFELWDVVRDSIASSHVFRGLDVAVGILLTLSKGTAGAIAPASGLCAVS
jgi:hypothetical protein